MEGENKVRVVFWVFYAATIDTWMELSLVEGSVKRFYKESIMFWLSILNQNIMLCDIVMLFSMLKHRTNLTFHSATITFSCVTKALFRPLLIIKGIT
jgi:hypothetical protein